mmetsp:Transcript_41715/g.97789  ORF Transcript_41715/g.97789 Transcript_41715/m.97789 type:complete len:83 (-) Transcript_41715:642-890(-)
MLSHFFTVDNRCAISITLHVPAIACTMVSKASCTKASLTASRAEVASSNSNKEGWRSKARAIAKRCFWPPLSRTPPSPTCDL